MKFVWDESDTADTWEKRLAKRYYDKLFKEYCICDLSYYKINKIAMRWRIEKEVVEGKGQFICGDKKCTVRDGLRSWEGLRAVFIQTNDLIFSKHRIFLKLTLVTLKKEKKRMLWSSFVSSNPTEMMIDTNSTSFLFLKGLCPECSLKLNFHHQYAKINLNYEFKNLNMLKLFNKKEKRSYETSETSKRKVKREA